VFFCPADKHARSSVAIRTSDGMQSNQFLSYHVLFLPGWTVTPEGAPLLRLNQLADVRPLVRDVVLRKMVPSGYPFETAHGTRGNQMYTDGSVRNVSVE
jgi:prepilin-type processing-associated H-X9-DG protein